jgi:hypothetical protein
LYRDKNILVVEYLDQRLAFFIEKFGHQNLWLTDHSGEAIRYLIDYKYDYLFLGGDLGEYGGSCYDIAHYLSRHIENPNNRSTIIIHSWNPGEVQSILAELPTAMYHPYSEAFLSTLRI